MSSEPILLAHDHYLIWCAPSGHQLALRRQGVVLARGHQRQRGQEIPTQAHQPWVDGRDVVVDREELPRRLHLQPGVLVPRPLPYGAAPVRIVWVRFVLLQPLPLPMLERVDFDGDG